MIENIVRRGEEARIKRTLRDGTRGIRLADLLESIKQEYKENEDLRTRQPRRLGEDLRRKGERIVYVRTIFGQNDELRGGRAIRTRWNGAYL